MWLLASDIQSMPARVKISVSSGLPEKRSPELWKPQASVTGISWLAMASSASLKSRRTTPLLPVSS